MPEAKAFLAQMVSKTSTESANLYYDFTLSGDVIFCREAYVEAEGLLRHLDNVGPILSEFLKIADVLRVELHASAQDLAKLKEALTALKPECFEFYAGVARKD
jgi:hypothetical protein